MRPNMRDVLSSLARHRSFLGAAGLVCVGCARAGPGDGLTLPAPGTTVSVLAPSALSTDSVGPVAPLEPLPPASASAQASTSQPQVCPDDMTLVDGDYCADLPQKCLRHRQSWQCAEFEAPSRCAGKVVHKRYCIDRYEWPNEAGSMPTVMNSWMDAKQSCAARGKRMCTESEWTLACEGPEHLAFPYGHVRDASACPIDKPSPLVNEKRLFWPATRDAELARLDQREPSGARARCVSAYGVHDLTGNVDEWVVNETGQPYRSSLKGGNWGEYRNACRPVTRGHSEGFRYYQTGFRCCREAP